MDFYAQVPKSIEENLEYRIALRRRAAHDVGFQRAMMAASRHDFLFWLNAFVWLYEPRPLVVGGVKLPHCVPFITWPHQDPVIREIKEHLGYEDIGAEKSRGEGMSWIACMAAEHEWIFEPMTAIGLVSRNENAVDNPEDPDSLFWKIDWELTKLPKWMVPPFKRNQDEHTLRNLANHSTIAGYAATGDVASGGRKKWFLMDELAKFPRGPDKDAMASTQYVTNSRLVVSTPKGTDGAYYELMHKPSSMIKVVLDWKDNPTRNRGLYQLIDGKPVAVDPVNNPLPKNYDPPDKLVLERFARLRQAGFKLEGKLRSPWYDHECDRPGATPQNIAQELDRDYGGTMFRIFGVDFFAKAQESVHGPFLRGVLTYHPETLEPEFDLSDDGPVLLWTPLDARMRPPMAPYSAGVDVCTGLGGQHTSNSTLEIVNCHTGEHVLEIVANTIAPSDWADLCMAACKWFHNAYLVWEQNGPGAGFAKRVLEKGYGNFYYRTLLWKRSKRKTKEAGWWTDEKTKVVMFGELSRSVKAGEVKLRSDILVKEAGQYVSVRGKITHVLHAGDDDSSGGQSHGDRVVGMAMAIQGLRDRPLMSPESVPGDVSPHCMAGRQRALQEAQKKQGGVWDDRTNWDMMAG